MVDIARRQRSENKQEHMHRVSGVRQGMRSALLFLQGGLRMERNAEFGQRIRRKAAVIALFAYGMAVGTAAPVVLSRCTSSGCGSCAGLCTLSLGILPLLILMALTGRLRRAGNRLARYARRPKRTRSVRDA